MASAVAGQARVVRETMAVRCSFLMQPLLCRGNFVLVCGGHVTFPCRSHDVQDHELEGCSQPDDHCR